MLMINFEDDQVQSVTQIDAAKSLSDKVLELKMQKKVLTS